MSALNRLLLPVLVMVLGVVGLAYAAHEPAAPVRMPYQGHLELDGTPVDGVASLTFELFDAESGGTRLYTETTDVVVVRGRFVHLLGENVALDSDDVAGRELWLALAVEGAPLGGRQLVVPAARAVSAERAHDLTLTTGRNTGWNSWNEALHLDTGPNGAITQGDLLFGLSSGNARFYWADVDNPTSTYDMILDTGSDTLLVDNLGSVRAQGVSVGGGTPITKLAHGRAGNCASGTLPSRSTHDFGGVTFTTPPRVFLQPVELDDAGCVSARVVGVTVNGFTLRSYTVDVVSGCGCVDWLAVGF